MQRVGKFVNFLKVDKFWSAFYWPYMGVHSHTTSTFQK